MFISICIPTYNSGSKLEKLLDSIRIQTFGDYEIVISDDSRDNNVKKIVEKKYSDLNIHYYQNLQPLGTPENWNNAVSKSTGKWIKLMHHDDWFYDKHSLQVFVNNIAKDSKARMVFCAFQNAYLDKGTTENFYCSKLDIFLLRQNYLNLFKTFMGNPSCTLINSSYKPYKYDKRFKWLIDFDFYCDYFKNKNKFIYINETLIVLGMHSEQVTSSVFQNPYVEVPESISLLNKHGVGILKNVLVYDFYWRLYRNINIRNLAQFNQYLKGTCNYKSIESMIKIQEQIPVSVLKIGVISKSLMLISYLKNYFLSSKK